MLNDVSFDRDLSSIESLLIQSLASMPKFVLNFLNYWHRFNIKLFYDQTFKGVFGDESVNVLRRVVAQAQNIYYYPTLPAIVTLQVGAVEEVFVSLNADTAA